MAIAKTMKKTKIFDHKRYALYKEYVGMTPAKMRRHFIAAEHPEWKVRLYRSPSMNVGLYVLKPKAKKKKR